MDKNILLHDTIESHDVVHQEEGTISRAMSSPEATVHAVDYSGDDGIQNDNSSRVEIRKLRRSSSLPGHIGRRPFTLRRSIRASRLLSKYRINNSNHLDSLTEVLSGLYAMILVVVGVSLPISHITVPDVTRGELEAFYIYLFLIGNTFMVYVYVFIIHAEKYRVTSWFHSLRTGKNSAEGGNKYGSSNANPTGGETELLQNFMRKELRQKVISSTRFTFSTTETLSGSYYLRLGALVFGLCTVVENGMELSLTMEQMILKSSCSVNTSRTLIRQLLQILFTTTQLYFIFLNSKICIHRYRTLAQFGAMHMVATNLCSWLRYITMQTAKVVVANGTTSSRDDVTDHRHHHQVTDSHHHGITQNVSQHREINTLHAESLAPELARAQLPSECVESTFLSRTVMSINHFLFPFVVEYCLISAAIMVIVWANTDRKPQPTDERIPSNVETRRASLSKRASSALKAVRDHFSMDCQGVTRGLFSGIFLLFITLVAIIMCVVLVRQQKSTSAATGSLSSLEPTELTPHHNNSHSEPNHNHNVDNSHDDNDFADDVPQKSVIIISQMLFFILYNLAGSVSCAAAYRIRNMRFIRKSKRMLDEVLLVVSLVGVFMLRGFHAIAGYYNDKEEFSGICSLTVLTSMTVIFQGFSQTVFILDALHRLPRNSDQQITKPGLNCVTFLLLCNVTIWISNLLVMLSEETNQLTLHFYGPIVWSIISHVATPLTIFYQFHATVCLSVIWKTSYKIKDN